MRKSFIGALIILVFVGAWFIFGQGFIALYKDKNSEAEAEIPDPTQEAQAGFQNTAKPFSVLVKRFEKSDSSYEMNLLGRSQPSKTINMRTEVEGEIVQVNFDEGQVVDEGESLARISVDDRESVLALAQTNLKRAKANYEAARTVAGKGFQSRLSVLNNEAELRTAERAVLQAEQNLERLNIVAPFSGVINSKIIFKGSYATKNMVIGTIIDIDPLEVRFSLSEKFYRFASVGKDVRVVMANGIERKGQINFVSKTADSKTSTFEVRALIPNGDQRIPSGMSAEVFFLIPGSSSFEIPYSAFTLDESGNLIIRSVDENKRVVDNRITILRDSTDGQAWVVGVPENTDIIVAGQDFVLEGQSVSVTSDNDNS